MRLIDGDHLKRWIIARWEETDPTSEYPLRAIEVINQIDRESEYLNINKAVKDAYKHGKSKGIKKGRAMAQRMKGRWIHDGCDIPHGIDWMHCSVCGRREPYVPAAMTNYCPTCGADMRGEEDETD